MIEFPVVIVGGGPVGLTASILLSRLGIKSLLVERHPGTATLPKARGINARTMEMYRQLGLEENIYAAGMPRGFGGMLVWSESLAGKEIKRLTYARGGDRNHGVTPAAGCLCAQDSFEPVLRKRAEESTLASLRFNTQMVDFQHDEGGVIGTIADVLTGEATPFRARYLIAADGAKSDIRRKLGIEMQGTRDVYDSVNIHFRSDLTEWVADRPANLYFVEQPTLRGTFLTINAKDRWGFLVHSMKQYDYKPEDFTTDRCIEIVRQAVGAADLPVNVLGVGAWTASSLVAERYRDRAVFLAGDAAHEMPPTGGFGLNTGVQDAHNLAWKLAAVLHGDASDALLDTYDIERRPLAEKTVQTSLLNALSMGRSERQTEAKLPRSEFLNEQGLVFGARYVSQAVIEDGTSPPEVGNPLTDYVQSASPGCRAPHIWLMRGDRKMSAVDLYGDEFVMMIGPRGLAWREAAAAHSSPIVRTHLVGEEILDEQGEWQTLYGVDDDGAVLVRPDGYVAWRSRSMSATPEQTLKNALASILGT